MDRLNERMDSDGSDLERTATLAAMIAGLASDGKHRFSKSQRESLVLLEGMGVEGDAHAGPFVRHRFLARRKPTSRTHDRSISSPPNSLRRCARRTAFSVPATSARTC